MLKFTSNVSNVKLILVRRQITEGSCSALIVLRPQRRHYAVPPAAAPRKSRKLLWGTVGATLLTGAAVVYAKSSPEARNWLESNAPWANDVIALLYHENNTYWQVTTNQLGKATTALTNFLFGKEGVSPLEFPQRSEQDIDSTKASAKKDYQLPPAKFEPLYVQEKVIETPQLDTPATVIQTDKCEPATNVPIKITKDMVELEQDMHHYTKTAVDSYTQAAKHCAAYNKALYKVVESSVGELDRKHFTALHSAQTEKSAAADTAGDAAAKARCAIETLDRMIAAGVQAPPESIAASQRYIKQFRADLAAAEQRYTLENEKAVLSDRYWNKVEAARKMFSEELQALFPGVDLCARKLDLRGDTDLLLLYTLKQIQFLQNELAEIQTIRELKINRAIECHDEKAVIEAKVEDMIKTERLSREREYQKKALQLQAEANKNLHEQLKKQFEIQQEVIQDKLNRKEKEVMGKFNRSVSEQVERERVQFKKELAEMAGKLKAIEHTLKQRCAAEAEARRSQSLWAAAEALLAATQRPHAEAALANELTALQKAGEGDKLVQTILKGIPKEVRDKGVATEKALRDKFDQLEQTAGKVSLVGREGASLPVYFLSWLQAKLLFTRFSEIPESELNNQPTDFTALDTFDIMQRARYHMEHGALGAALRYVNLLQGAPRAAAAPFIAAARRHLEVRQAAEALMAHASVSGLLYL